MLIPRESRRRVEGLPDLVDYDSMVSDGVLFLSTGAFLAAWEMRGPDMDALSISDAHGLSAQIAGKLHLGAGWAIEAHQIREESQEYAPVCPYWPDPISRLIDEERRAQFSVTGDDAHLESSYYLSLAYTPKQAAGTRGQRYFFTQGDDDGQASRDLHVFEDTVEDLQAAFGAILRQQRHTFIRRLRSRTEPGRTFDDLLRYLRYCVFDENFPFARPHPPTLLNQHFQGDFSSGSYPRLDGRHICTIAIDSFPVAKNDHEVVGSFAGVLRELDGLPFRFRFTQQGECIDEYEANTLHSKNANNWSMVKIPWVHRLMDRNSNKVDPFAQRMETDANAAASDAQHGVEHYLRYTAKIILMREDPRELAEHFRMIKQTLRRVGFGCRWEKHNATRAWHSSFPGHMQHERRLSIAGVSNMADLMPLSAPYRGIEHNQSRFLPPETPPVFYASTLGRTPFRFHFHIEDVPHTLIAGPSGSGKTTFQAFALAQWPRLHPRAQMFAFDKEKTLYTLTKAMGGDYYDLSPGATLPFCPLQDLETPEDLSDGAQYMELLCALNGLTITSRMRNSISDSLHLMADSSMRSLTHFQAIIGPEAPEVKEALQFYTIGSAASAGILDGVRDNLNLSNYSVFEVGALYKMDVKITAAVLFHIFRKIWKRLDSSVPTLVSVDELRASLDHPLAVSNFEKFLIEGRKLNMELMLSIQELGKLVESPLRHTVLRECQTKIFLPNTAAMRGERPIYDLFELTEIDLEYISKAQPCRDYYYTSPEGKRMISLELGRVALAFLAGSGKEDRRRVDEMMARNPTHWQADWLRSKRLDDWAEFYETIAESKEVAAYA